VFDSPDLPHNDMGGLGRKDSTSPHPRRGRGYRLGEVLVKPVRLVDKRVMGVLRMTVSDVPCPLGEDAGEREDIRRKGHVLRVNSVDRHHIDVRVPEASPWSPIRIRSRMRGWVQWPQGRIHPPLDLSVHQDVTQLGSIPWGKRAHRHLSNAGTPGLSPRATCSRRSRRGRRHPPSSRMSSSLSKLRNLGSTVTKARSSPQNSGPNTAEGSGRDSRRGDGNWGGVPPPAPADDVSALARASARKASVSESQSNEKRCDDDGAWGGGTACLCLHLWGMCQSQVVTVKVKRLSV
jgi:hypothetical protein